LADSAAIAGRHTPNGGANLMLKTRKLAVGFVIAVLASLLGFTTASLAGADKSEVCHINSQGEYSLINVDDNSFDKHLAHGDGTPGGLVSDMLDYVFDDNCVPVTSDTDGDGVNDGDDNCPAIANADQSDRYGSAKGDACEDDSNGDGTLDVNKEHICVSIDGAQVIQNGFAGCSSHPTTGTAPNIAVGHGIWTDPDAQTGDNNTATADGNRTKATAANGVNASANASNGDNNAATAIGDGTEASAFAGSNNLATVTAKFGLANASNGSYKTATSAYFRGQAVARWGDRNTAVANGFCQIEVGGTSATNLMSNITASSP
jgi:hypothetical protein